MTDSAKRFDDLSYKTKEFLSGLRDDEVETLNDGIRLVNSIRTVGILGTGTVMFGESLAKIMGWMRG